MAKAKKTAQSEKKEAKIPEEEERGDKYRILGSMSTDVGSVREINQDSMLSMQFTLNECSVFNQPRLFIVADGMGGGADGEVASSMAIRKVAEYILHSLLSMEKREEIDISILANAVQEANLEIHNYANEDSVREGMGSTITGALLLGRRLLIGHVGDTRAYIINKESIRQITEDHSLVNRLLKMGQLTEEQAKNYPHKNLIYRTLGAHPKVEVEQYEEFLEVGDTILICCDGLWDYFPNEELHELVANSDDFDETTETMIDLAIERGGKDNITVILFQLAPAV